MARLPFGAIASSEKRSVSTAFDTFLTACVAVGVFLRVLWLGKREFWYDEVLSVLLSSGQKNAYKLPHKAPIAIGDVAALFDISGQASPVSAAKDVVKGTLGDPHPPLFYVSEHVWMRLFGHSELALRSLVVLVSIAVLVLAYLLGCRLLGRRGGLMFTALMSLNPFFMAHSLNLRMYVQMMFWVLMSGLCFLALVDELKKEGASRRRGWLLRVGVVGGLTAGLLTQYLFAYWLFGLVVLVLYVDRKRWLQHGLMMGASVVLFVPWVLWGVRQQINNRGDVLNQISAVGGPVAAAIAHAKDLAHTLANHLLLGHLTTGFAPVGEPIKPAAVAVGCGVIAFLVMCAVGLYRRRQYRVLMIAGIMGFVPLGVALAIDVLANKYTLGFGWGRSTIVALPGCVLLIAAWLELGTGRWRTAMTAGVLAVYLAVNLGDFLGRDRQVFHTLADGYVPETNEPALVVMNTRAWGHTLRLAYYMERFYPSADGFDIDLLATDAADVTDALGPALAGKDYRTVLWLKSEYPLWEAPKTEAEAISLSAGTETFLNEKLEQVGQSVALRGTMNLDMFELRAYRQ